MFIISLSILPFVLLLFNDVTSFDLYKSKQVPRRHTGFTRTYNSNHPPIMENYDNIPGTVTYKDQDRQQNAKRVGIFSDHEKNNFNYGKAGRIVQNPKTRSMHHPPSADKYDSIQVTIMNEYDGESILKPNAKSINIPASNEKSKRSQNPQKLLVESERKTGNKIKRSRSQQIRKVKVNKSQLELYINETESSVFKTENTVNKESKTKTVSDQTRTNEQSFKISKNQMIPKRGKQLSDPIVPIIESESYVFSHSGDFHYSYEGGDGTKAFERGELKSSNSGKGTAVDGGFSYKDKDGKDFSLTYTADENGYRPVGAHLPTPPPIPPAIQRALDFLATKTTPEPITERIKTIKNK